MTEPVRDRLSPWGVGALAGAVVFSQAIVWRTGLFVTDEGWTNHIASRLAGGEILYRDVHSYLPPLTYWCLQIPMLLQPSLLWGRMLSLVMCAVLVVATVLLLQRFGRRAAIVGGAAMGLLCACGYPSYTIPSYTGLSVAAAMSAWVLWEERRFAFVCGALLIVAVLFKQTTGIAAIAALVGAQLHERRLGSRALLAGSATAAIAATAILLVQGAFGPMLVALSPTTMATYGRLATVGFPSWSAMSEPTLVYSLPFLVDLFPWVYQEPLPWWAARAVTWLLYCLPVPMAVICFALARGDERSRERGLALLALATYLTLFPRADIAHLLQVLPPTIVVGVRLLVRTPLRRAALGLAVLAAIMAIGLNTVRRGAYSAPLNVPRDGGVRVLPTQVGARDIVLELRQRPGEEMLAAPWGAMFYFLADRPNATRFPLLLPGNISEDDKREIMEQVQARPPVDLVWSTVDLRNLFPMTYEEFFPELVGFRDASYERVLGPLGGEELWRLRPSSPRLRGTSP